MLAFRSGEGAIGVKIADCSDVIDFGGGGDEFDSWQWRISKIRIAFQARSKLVSGSVIADNGTIRTTALGVTVMGKTLGLRGFLVNFLLRFRRASAAP